MTFDNAFDLVARYAAQVGFEKVALPTLEGAPEISSASGLWSAPYAQILVMPVESQDPDTLKRAAQRGQEWLDLSCMAQEHHANNVIDGYLLLLLAAPPDKGLRSIIREIEVDPTACRKHVGWPVEGGKEADLIWARIFRVTAMGIPKSPESTGMTGSPVLGTPLQRKLLEDIKELKGRNAARQHAENPSLAPDI